MQLTLQSRRSNDWSAIWSRLVIVVLVPYYDISVCCDQAQLEITPDQGDVIRIRVWFDPWIARNTWWIVSLEHQFCVRCHHCCGFCHLASSSQQQLVLRCRICVVSSHSPMHHTWALCRSLQRRHWVWICNEDCSSQRSPALWCLVIFYIPWLYNSDCAEQLQLYSSSYVLPPSSRSSLMSRFNRAWLNAAGRNMRSCCSRQIRCCNALILFMIQLYQFKWATAT